MDDSNKKKVSVGGSNKKIRITVTEACPDIEKYWDYEKNEGRKPSDFSKAASDKVWTYCPICGTSVKRNVRYSWEVDENGIGHVIHCRVCGKRNDDNSLIKLFPDIKKYWIYEKNEHGPEYYSISSGKKVFIKCPSCGKERNLAICDAVSQDSNGVYYLTSCLDCLWERNSLVRRRKPRTIDQICPDIYQYWDKKNTTRPDELPLSAVEKVYTHCPSCGDILYRRVVNTFGIENGVWHVKCCQKCAASKANIQNALLRNGSIIKECPEIEEWWDYEKNQIDISKITRGSHYEAYLKCPACNNEIQRDIHSFIAMHLDGRLLPVACPKCGYSSKGDPEDNLVSICPDIVKWWDYEKNAPYKPEQFTRGAQFTAYLRCPDCGLELYTGIHSLLTTNSEGKVVIGHEGKCRKFKAMVSKNNLVSRYPQITEWWDYEKNSPEVPEEYTMYSPKQAYFKCPNCGAETYRRITDAFSEDEDGIPALFKCPYCNNKRVLPGFNSFKARHDDLLKTEWSNIENTFIGVDPDKILDSYSGLVWWKCPNCGKKYMMSVQDRLMKKKRGHDPCLFCNGRRWKKTYFI